MYKNFFLQLIQRVATESPKFFKIIKWTAGIIGVLAIAATHLINNHIWNPSYGATLNAITTSAWPILVAVWGMSILPVKDQTPKIPIK